MAVVAGPIFGAVGAVARVLSQRDEAEVPPSITTPDRVDSRSLGPLVFQDAMPDAETVRNAQDFVVVARGVEAFPSGLPAPSPCACAAVPRQAGRRAELNPDGTFTAYFGSAELCGDVPNRLDAPEGWNFMMRVYLPDPETVLGGRYELPETVPAKR